MNHDIDILTTRFNTETWSEHDRWNQKSDFRGCIYSSPITISSRLRPDALAFVIEMNNSTNRIEGIGLIRNQISRKKYRKYTYRGYTRHTYIGKHYIPVSQMTTNERAFIWIIEQISFYGKSHMKRGQGLSLVPRWWMTNRTIHFISCFRQMFLDRWQFDVSTSALIGMRPTAYLPNSIIRCCDELHKHIKSRPKQINLSIVNPNHRIISSATYNTCRA